MAKKTQLKLGPWKGWVANYVRYFQREGHEFVFVGEAEEIEVSHRESAWLPALAGFDLLALIEKAPRGGYRAVLGRGAAPPLNLPEERTLEAAVAAARAKASALLADIATLEKAMAAYDWAAEKADDQRVWREAKEEWALIEILRASVPERIWQELCQKYQRAV